MAIFWGRGIFSAKEQFNELKPLFWNSSLKHAPNYLIYIYPHRLRNMTEEERRLEAKQNPKRVTNKAAKGKYKFLQKYYHRGAFFLDKEQDVFKRDISHATLEDKFDKTVLPKVMQVKNFGRSGRTKYTHLVDQDTTQFDAAWSQESAQNVKFQVNHAAGMKNVFERPSAKKKK